MLYELEHPQEAAEELARVRDTLFHVRGVRRRQSHPSNQLRTCSLGTTAA